MDFQEIEKKVLKFWKDNRIFEKSIAQREKSRDFVFYEGPPTANGKPGIHHLETRAFKDAICRYKTMKGFRVLRKAGWDTHGLPVELEVEKELGFKSKKDIEKFGLAKFNQKCKASVWQYKTEWEQLTEKIGYWLDLHNPYITYDTDYIETLWWIIKQVSEKGLLYQDYRVVPYCPRCGTSLSSHEVAQGYKKIKEPSIYVKFPVKGQKNTYFLVWTTTPWTLPGNAAVAVNSKFTYVVVKQGKENLILAKDRIKENGIQGKIIKEIKGRDLIGLEYIPAYQQAKSKEQQTKNIYKIVDGDFVSLDEGTGLVHIAPAFGENDMAVGKKNDLPVLVTVDEQGKMLAKGYKWDKMFVKKADPLIVEDLKIRGLLFKQELYEHDYPFCWRCKTPLIYYAKKSWFIQMTKIKQDLIKNNQKINWIPTHLKQGRFGEWLKDLKDWTISRERYWGTPLPVWKCAKCGQIEIIGSKKDLIKQKFTANKYFVLRHGESECYNNRIAVSSIGKNLCPLTKRGEQQIKKAAKELKKQKIDIIFSSDLLRTKRTAEIIGKELGIKVKYNRRLREIKFGIFDGKAIKEWIDFWKNRSDRFTKRPPKGENYNDVKDRVGRFLEIIDKKYKGKNILIVSHGGPILMMDSIMKGFSREQVLDLDTYKKIIKVGEWHKLDFRILPYNEQGELDFHRPYIDEVKFFCPKCAKKMERVPEVLDCWFDSGAMPFAQSHWPFNDKLSVVNDNLKPPKLFPADYICEAVDQTRGWFYTLLAVSSLLGFGNSYKNVISLGHVLDEKGEKMSKSKGNVVDPWHIIDKFGVDAVRWYFYTINQPGDSKLFTEKDVDQALKKFVMTLMNVFVFFETYVSNPLRHLPAGKQKSKFKAQNLLDKWVVSELNGLVARVGEKMDKYDVVGAARDIEDFTINDLSLWYVRRSRKRFQRPQNKLELEQAGQTLGYVLMELSKLCAPFAPFLSEHIYQELKGKEQSVHLEDLPKVNKKFIDEKLEKQMDAVREIVGEALAQRAKAGIKVRQPLALLRIKNYDLRFKNNEELLGLIKDEVNVRDIVFDSKIKNKVELDTKITAELKEQGIVREVVRAIQGMRKIAGYKPRHKILIRYFGTAKLNKILARNTDFILSELTAKDFLRGDKHKQVFDIEKELKIDQQDLWLGIKKI